MIVELKYAGIPWLGVVAVHYWFVTEYQGKRERWEVWHRPNVRGEGIGHLHRNLMHPDASVGGSAARVAVRWSGECAERIHATLERSKTEYPYYDHYRVLPGPNSNTFIAWILTQSGIDQKLSWRAHGKRFVP